MQVKTFQATDMPEALRMVKAEFGPDAMILSSRKDKRRGLLGFYSKPYFEVTAALDSTPRNNREPDGERVKREPNTQEEFQRSMLAPLARELKELRTRVETMSVREGNGAALRQGRAGGPAPRTDDFPGDDYLFKARNKPASGPAPRTLPRSEVEELKKVLLRSMTATDGAGPAAAAVTLEQAPEGAGETVVAKLTAELRAGGVGEEEIRTLLGPVEVAAARGEGHARQRELLNESITASVRCSGPLTMKKGAPRILALVGPTGVGKTTTIAKLAALAYKQGGKVALITIDTFRIGGVKQLETYSGIMGLPLTVATTPAELAEAIDAHADKQLIFIDTAGRSPRDRDQLLEMKAFLEVNPAIEIHLCLSATTRDRELARVVDRFGVLPVRRLLFTKLDESESFGCIINVHLQRKLPLSYFTTGQRVPEDIEAATAKRLLNLVIRSEA